MPQLTPTNVSAKCPSPGQAHTHQRKYNMPLPGTSSHPPTEVQSANICLSIHWHFKMSAKLTTSPTFGIVMARDAGDAGDTVDARDAGDARVAGDALFSPSYNRASWRFSMSKGCDHMADLDLSSKLRTRLTSTFDALPFFRYFMRMETVKWSTGIPPDHSWVG